MLLLKAGMNSGVQGVTDNTLYAIIGLLFFFGIMLMTGKPSLLDAITGAVGGCS